jgi:hypothetical protein
MVRSGIAQMRGDAKFVAGIRHNGEIVETIRDLRNQASVRDGDRDTREKYAGELVARHLMDVSPAPRSQIADVLSNLSTYQMLMTSPSYVLQQILPNPAQTLPYLAGEHGARAYPAMARSVGEVMKVTKGAGVVGPLDLSKLDANHQALAQWLESVGKLDVGLSQEAFKYRSEGTGKVSQTFRSVDTFMRNFTRRGEALNRLTAGLTAYDLALTSGKPIKPLYDKDAYPAYLRNASEAGQKNVMTEREFAAAYKAMDAIDNTHYDYSNYSKQRFMRNPVAQVIGQFKTFPMRQAELYTTLIRDAYFDKNLSAEDRAAAGRTLNYMVGHAAVLAGALGLPAVGLVRGIAEAVLNMDPDKEEPANIEKMIRDSLGPENSDLADLLLHGAPALAGLNLTGSMGQANILSLTPYTDLPTDEKSYEAALTASLGPTIGGVLPAAFKAVEFAGKGDYYKGLEQVLPKGFANVARAYRESTEGITNKRGEVTTPASDIDVGRTVATALGLQTIQRSREQEALGQKIDTDNMMQSRSSKLTRRYVEASRQRDTAAMQEVRQQWMALQAARVKAGLQRQPMSTLARASRSSVRGEKNTVGGLQYNRSNREEVRRLAESYGLLNAPEEVTDEE